MTNNISNTIIKYFKNFFKPQGIFDQQFVKKPLMLYVAFGLLLAMIPSLQEAGLIQFYTMRVFGTIIIYAIVALGLNLLLGFSGLISLGTAGFIGFGAYGLPYFSNTLGLSFFGATIITLIIAAIIGALIGLFSLKVEGVYLAIATLFVGEIFLEVFKNVEWFTNGFSGVRFHYPKVIFLFFNLRIKESQYFVLKMIVLAILAMVIMIVIIYKQYRKHHPKPKPAWYVNHQKKIRFIGFGFIGFIALLLLIQKAMGESIITVLPDVRTLPFPTFRSYLKLKEFDRDQTFQLLVLFLIGSMFVIYNIVNSRTGRALMAMSRSEHAAQAMGISVLKYRLVAFVTATVFATLAGVLYVSWFKFVDPTSWTLSLSLTMIAIVVVGGFKSIFGMFVGAYIIHGISTFYLKEIFKEYSGVPYIFSGLLIILVVLFYPYGAVYLWQDVKKLSRKTKEFVRTTYNKWKNKGVNSDEK